MPDISILEDQIIITLKTIYDPELPVNIYDLGLIYEIDVSDPANVKIIMTLTSPNCPVAESLPGEVREKVDALVGIKSTKVKIVFDPTWTQEMMSEEAKFELGFL
ncbi:MAG: SUF system Fe-S cluster assembly protein [Bacteroidales bacterium]|nr:SUF system Fe-S cluster assembly protein [Bacteroidales bacterium]